MPLEPEGGEGVAFCPWCGEVYEGGVDVHEECEKKAEERAAEGGKGGVTSPGKRKVAKAPPAAGEGVTPVKRKAAAVGGDTGSGRVKRNKVMFRERESERYFNAEEPPSAIR